MISESTRASREAARERWDRSFEEQIAQGAYNRAAVEAVVRVVAHHLRERVPEDALTCLHFLEMGCGAGPNLVWLAQKGLWVSGIDVSPTALELARRQLQRSGCADRVERLVEGSVSEVPFPDATFDGIIEACVFQHLARPDRERAFGEVRRLLKPGGVFVGYMLDVEHTVFRGEAAEQMADDPGSLMLTEGGSAVRLEGLGLSHFFCREELLALLEGFAVVEPLSTTYELPSFEAAKRGYREYRQSMWTVYAVK